MHSPDTCTWFIVAQKWVHSVLRYYHYSCKVLVWSLNNTSVVNYCYYNARVVKKLKLQRFCHNSSHQIWRQFTFIKHGRTIKDMNWMAKTINRVCLHSGQLKTWSISLATFYGMDRQSGQDLGSHLSVHFLWYMWLHIWSIAHSSCSSNSSRQILHPPSVVLVPVPIPISSSIRLLKAP